jgi:hypothetical protein
MPIENPMLCWVLFMRRPYNRRTADTEEFFRRLGKRLREIRRERGLSQGKMILLGFSAGTGNSWRKAAHNCDDAIESLRGV